MLQLNDMLSLGAESIAELPEVKKQALRVPHGNNCTRLEQRAQVKEVERVLHPLGYRLSPLKDFPEIPEPPETSATFEANALQKLALFLNVQDNRPLQTTPDSKSMHLMADPVYYSKRYTPEATAEITTNARRDRERRTALCPLCLCARLGDTRGERVCGEAPWKDSLLPLQRGRTDLGMTLFSCPPIDLEKSMAELSANEKDAISHRGAAWPNSPIRSVLNH